ncbi:CopG family transcriptional regulator [Sandaracinobacteroides saxicola]|uniref:CopG family transcriptional regulator n=1 Tax=Sandaracinobacteroides saxicola TaxID=2759707 RepID=A0A7G5IHS7_9SPHN|nr:CopG family transcriptional regulator [Sandaracinobacteroides saxicola]QMW22919.1 CopG family transcriptional regulator [Sandaracinobacteroides saxicola]
MRTTLAIDDDVLAAAREFAEARGESLGAAATELIRRGLNPVLVLETRNGVPLLPSRSGRRPVTPEEINDMKNDLDLEFPFAMEVLRKSGGFTGR